MDCGGTQTEHMHAHMQTPHRMAHHARTGIPTGDLLAERQQRSSLRHRAAWPKFRIPEMLNYLEMTGLYCGAETNNSNTTSSYNNNHQGK